MRLLVLGRRPSGAVPAPASVVALPVAVTVPTVGVAVAPRVHVSVTPADAGRVPDVADIGGVLRDVGILGDVDVVAPVVVHVRVADPAVPAPATPPVPAPASIPPPPRADTEPERESGEHAHTEAQGEWTPAPGHRPRVPEGADPARIDIPGPVHDGRSRRYHRPHVARCVARV